VPAGDDKPTLEELVEHTKSQLASYKAPSYVAIVDELPRNPLGKVLKTELRKQHGEADNG
ncbi:MAG: long-chain fatty acid--CoA ligase, partial [Chloroflexi bacterium]|nr:long-chain fatty acid--CoA ligase [Chloroflexota bacterium]